jgi:hypothetical protein
MTCRHDADTAGLVANEGLGAVEWIEGEEDATAGTEGRLSGSQLKA